MDTLPPDLTFPTEDARKIGLTSARIPSGEVLGPVDRRRSWTVEQKREIVCESLGPELTPTEVARKYGISTGQLYTWRQQILSLPGSVVSHAPPRFAPVELAASPAPEPAPAQPPSPASPSLPPRAEGLIEILLPRGVCLRVDAHVDTRALRRILSALEGR
jgi:transposase